jgi:hypothetical protein
MFHFLIKILSFCLLISITFSFPLPQSQGQFRNHTGATEITFFGKEETKWIEKREVPLPVIMGQGIKEEPRLDSFDLREDSIGPMQKMSASTTQPGCAYSSRFTSGLAKAFVGDKALYEQGRSQYLKGAYEDAIASFKKGLKYDSGNSDLKQALQKLGVRKQPPVPFLDRSNPINKYIGMMLHKAKKSSGGKTGMRGH